MPHGGDLRTCTIWRHYNASTMRSPYAPHSVKGHLPVHLRLSGWRGFHHSCVFTPHRHGGSNYPLYYWQNRIPFWGGANNGNRTHILGLEGRCTSLCTMSAYIPAAAGFSPYRRICEPIGGEVGLSRRHRESKMQYIPTLHYYATPFFWLFNVEFYVFRPLFSPTVRIKSA